MNIRNTRLKSTKTKKNLRNIGRVSFKSKLEINAYKRKYFMKLEKSTNNINVSRDSKQNMNILFLVSQ